MQLSQKEMIDKSQLVITEEMLTYWENNFSDAKRMKQIGKLTTFEDYVDIMKLWLILPFTFNWRYK